MNEKTLLKIEIKQSNDEIGMFIDIINNDYNIIDQTIYDNELANKILELIKDNME